MPVYHVQPRELLFFRDARPMETQSASGGHGAHWPHPAVLFDAIHAALWRAYPKQATRQELGFAYHPYFLKENGRRVPFHGQRTWFDSLVTAGPFPVLEDEWLFPAPADVQPGGRVLPITTHPGVSDLSAQLQYPLGATVLPTKQTVAPWWTKSAIEGYLAGCDQPAPHHAFESSELFAAEWTTGIGISPATGTQDGEHIYSAQYLRLLDQARLGLWATLPEAQGFDGLDQLFQQGIDLPTLVAGGQRRVCRVQLQPNSDLTRILPISRPLPRECTRLKWVLMSPAIFPKVPGQQHDGGWLPTWIDPKDHSVRLNRIQADKCGGGRLRRDRRKSTSEDLLRCCQLVAARIPKPVCITGWTRELHAPGARPDNPGAPRKTLLAVPAGAAYYFEAHGARAVEATQLLWELLSWHGESTQYADRIVHRRSSLFGEKGFGLGVCSDWRPFPG